MMRFSGVGGGGGSLNWGGAVLDRGDRGDRHDLRHYDCGATLATTRGVFAAATVRGAEPGPGSDPGAPGAAEGCSGDGKGSSGGVDGGAGDIDENENENENEAPVCRFCFEEADDVGARGGNLIIPCACSGSQAYIHTRCLHTWQNTAVDGGLRCQVCCELFKAPPKPWLDAAWNNLQRIVRRRAGRFYFIYKIGPHSFVHVQSICFAFARLEVYKLRVYTRSLRWWRGRCGFKEKEKKKKQLSDGRRLEP